MYSILFQPNSKEILIDTDDDDLTELKLLLLNRKVKVGDIAYVIEKKQKYIVGHDYEWHIFNFPIGEV